jgi:hypothetical protein
MSPWPDTRIARLLRPASGVVPLLGAGISVPSGLPTGAVLADWMRGHQIADGVDFSGLGDSARRNPLVVSQVLVDTHPERKSELLSAVREHMATLCDEADLSQELMALASAPSGLIITLNYDDLIERAAEAEGRPVESLGRDAIAGLVTDHLGETDGVLRVVHLHGSIRATDPLVLANDDYRRAIADASVRDLFVAVVSRRPLCLLGTSFEEPYLAVLLQSLKPSVPKHVIVCEESSAEQVTNGEGSVTSIVHGVVPCSHADGDFRAIAGFVAKLVEGDSEVALRRAPAPLEDPLYTDRRFLPLDVEKERDPEVALMVGDVKLVDENHLRERSRVLVLGLPGGGKSHLMANLAGSPLPGECAALVRLRSVRDFVGEPQALLDAWLRAPEADCADLAIDDVVAGEVRLHLVLDGLDEVSPADRPAAVDAIARLGEALPQTRMTLSTRPTAAIDGFGAEWERYALRCDSQWQAEFLAKAGTSMDGLSARLGAIAPAVEPLLEIPFFLRRLVELDGTVLASAVSGADALGVLDALLDQQIADDPNLELVRAGVAQWLGRVAMLMQITGRRAVVLDDICPLAADLNLGNIETLTNHLANRSLLEESADRWSFGHRIFSEALVAVQLEVEDPIDWLDIVAPEFDGRSAVREDWLAPLELVCARSLEWRASIRIRDPVAAARLTPATADPAERVEAAAVLWGRASDLQIWLDEKYDHGFDSGEIIARLLNDGDGAETLMAQVEALFESGTRYDRANALDVLLRVRPESASEFIRGVLEGEQDSTLRRHAASWARRLERRDLVELVLDRACSPADDAEAIDMASIAIELTEPELRATVGRRILASGNTEVRDWQVFEDAPTIENLRWLLDSARADPDDISYGIDRKLDEVLDELFEPTDDEARVVGELVVACRTESSTAFDWVAAHPAAAEGVAQGLNREDVPLYVPPQLLLTVGSSRLRAGGAPDEVVERVEQWEVVQAQRVAAPPEAPRIVREVPPPPLPLEAVLALEGNGPYEPLLNQDTRLRREAEQAPPAIRQTLRSFLQREWSGKDLREGLTLTESGARVQYWVSLVLSYGPPAELDLDDEQWVQVATCGWLFTEQYRWIGRQANQARLDRAADVANPSARVLTGMFQVAEGLDSARVQARVAEIEGQELIERNGPGLLEVLSRVRAVDALREIQARGETFAALVDPLLARAGDVEAQRHTLRRLKDRLAQGEFVDRHDEAWVEAIDDPSLLELIVDAVVEAKNHPRDDDPPFDVTEALLGSIERVGGPQALEVLDRLITERPWDGAQWLQRMRNAVLQRELARVAIGPSEIMLARRSLPTLEIDTAPVS